MELERGWLRKLIYDFSISALAGIVIAMLTIGSSVFWWGMFGVALLMVIFSLVPFSSITHTKLSKDIFSTLSTPKVKAFIPTALVVSFVVSLGAQYYQDRELKQRAVSLSNEIFAFMRTSRAGEPPLARPETWEADTDKIVKYFQDTMVEFSVTYLGRVKALCMQLAERGLGDQSFQSNCKGPIVNTLGIQEIAGQLAALAEQLPKVENWFSGRWALSFFLSLLCSSLLWVVFGVVEHRLLSLQGKTDDSSTTLG